MKEYPCRGYPPPPDAGPPQNDAGRSRRHGRIDPAIVQKITRDHSDAIRGCYEEGLRRNRDLAGKVTTKFVIGADGAVQMAEIGCTSIPDDFVVDCVVEEVRTFVFPPPEWGSVTVIYPIMFNPAD
jgi:hypothetical protein